MNTFTDYLDKITIGENSALCHTTTNNPNLDLFFKLVRNIDENELFSLMNEIIITNNCQYIVELFVLCFQSRNCRGGKGERKLSYNILLYLYHIFPLTVKSIIHLYKDYGYWKDLINLLNFKKTFNINEKELVETIITIYSTQLKEDKIKMDINDKSISLAAKWAPRENHHFYKYNRNIYNQLLLAIFPELNYNDRYKSYRQLISSLNTFLNTTEVAMCNGNWSQINYSNVPSLNLNKWRKAHLNELLDNPTFTSKSCKLGLKFKFVPCTFNENINGNRYPDNEDRVNARKHLLETIRNPKKSISGKQLMPHEIINVYLKKNFISDSEKELLQAQWNSLKSTVISKGRKVIPLSDVSGSMKGLPMEVSIALGILLSEVTHDAFKNRIITFHDNPKWINLSNCTSLEEKVHILKKSDWGGSTNIEKVFDLILDIVKKNNLSSEDIPDLVIFSDMQFNDAINNNNNTPLQIVQDKFKSNGFVCPRIIFWNLRASIGFPTTENSSNVIMLSGFSQSLLKFILEDEIISAPTPLDIYLSVINDKLYDPIRVILNDSNEGILANYIFTNE